MHKEKAKFPRYQDCKPKAIDQTDHKNVLNFEKENYIFKINKLKFRINYLDIEINSKLPEKLKHIYKASNEEKLESVTIADQSARFVEKEYKNIWGIYFTKRRIIIRYKDGENTPKISSPPKFLVTEYKVHLEEKKEVNNWGYTSHESLWEASGYRGL